MFASASRSASRRTLLRLLFGATDGLGRDSLAVGHPPGKDQPGCEQGDEHIEWRSRRGKGMESACMKKAPLCRVGGSDEPAKAGGTAVSAALQASSRRGMHTARRRDSLGVIASAQTSPRTITRKAGNPKQFLPGDLITPEPRVGAPRRVRTAADPGRLRRGPERFVEQPLERGGALGPLLALAIAGPRAMRNNSSAILSAARTATFSVVAGRGLLDGQPHLRVDIRRELGDVCRRSSALRMG